ncbi:hypothetical protein WICPIJ_004395 [Wickerhamomyces pijperi]|uniref:Uncharacterized protein n=1 Tax=Wickerhamomyces pijperi TaxID=599730 RepID=A0A9P8Q837_WICPI|nr:hypothetical protein WICPIJ_004395 [Wickerhamomyces pijperi]
MNITIFIGSDLEITIQMKLRVSPPESVADVVRMKLELDEFDWIFEFGLVQHCWYRFQDVDIQLQTEFF